MKELSPAELRRKLEAGEPVYILDIREVGDYQSWRIHGSENFPVYHALSSGNFDALTSRLETLPKDKPVVAVCRAGIVSKIAAALLEKAGLEAYSLIGGMHGWSSAWSEARINLSGKPDATFIQVRRNGKGCLSYILGGDGECAIVDPCLDSNVYLDIASRAGLSIAYVLETHVHADHLSRARDICGACGAKVYLHPNERVTYAYEPVNEGDSLTVGGLVIKVIHTPGHTGESVCFLVEDNALLTGDTLFVESVGRPDLEKGDEGAMEGAEILYDSLQSKILTLPDYVKVFPAHYGKPIGFDGVPISATLGELRSSLEYLNLEKDAFVERIVGSLSAKPPNFQLVISVNEGKFGAEGLDPLDLEAGPNRCAAG